MTLDEFIAANGLTMSVERIASNPNMDSDEYMTRHWLCTLHSAVRDRELAIPFSQGSAHTEAPTIADVLDCLASDSAGVDESFESWCSELDYNPDSRRVERIYNTCRKQARLLRELLGPKAYKTLLWGVDRL